ncbi:MAG: GNAT family N-acetyltransferase [Clostridia bacterium]|nr:GNAT family N-acetyltransferase [Clostridia bacterium]
MTKLKLNGRIWEGMFSGEMFFTMPPIETERLLLRRLEMGDAQDIFDYGRDPEVARHVLWEAYESVSECKSYIRSMQRRYRAGDAASWGIVLKATGRVVGTIGYMWHQEEHGSAEVGYSLARDLWNRGYMTEALTAVIAYSFDTLHLNRLEAQHELTNPASGAVMKKCGMLPEGTLRQRLRNKGRYVDVALYAILRDDYLASTRRRGALNL